MINPSKIIREDYLEEPIVWSEQEDVEYPYIALLKGKALRLRLNDFPNQHLYTLVVEGENNLDFDDWPRAWRRQQDSRSELLARDTKAATLSGFVGSGTDAIGEATFKGMMRV